MGRYTYAVELYSVKDELARDMAGTLKKIKAMGYTAVEFAGGFVHTAEEVRRALEETGLLCCGWHTPVDYLADDRLAATAAYFRTVGNQNVIVPGLPAEMTASRTAWLRTADLFNRTAGRLADFGMRLGYHNHVDEVVFYAGSQECPLTVFGDNTDSSIIIQMDNGHVLNGRGFGMLDLIRRYPGRFASVHLKPYDLGKGAADRDAGYQTMIGEDDVPWAEFMTLCRKIGGTQWYVVEYESIELYPELEGVGKCLQSLQAMEARGEF